MNYEIEAKAEPNEQDIDLKIEAADVVYIPVPVPQDLSHKALRDRDKPKQHPIHAIERLPETLAGKVDVEPNHSLMSDAEHTKLAGIQAGAQVNLIESVKVNGSPLTIQGKAVNVTVPTVYATDLQYDQTKGIIKLIGADGSVIGSIDTNLERIIKSGRYDTASQELVFVTDDGSEIRVPVGDLVDTYTGDGTTITVADNVFSVAKAVMDQINSKADDAGVVHKAGDTMTGSLTISNALPKVYAVRNESIDRGVAESPSKDTVISGGFFVNDSKDNAVLQVSRYKDAVKVYTNIGLNANIDGTLVNNSLNQIIEFDTRNKYVTCPTPPAGSNGDQVVTAGYLNSAPTVVHTTGNENVAGIKTFTNNPVISNWQGKIEVKSNVTEIGVTGNQYENGGITISDKKGTGISWMKGKILEDLSTVLELTAYNKVGGLNKYASINLKVDSKGVPSVTTVPTPDGASGTEIVTAGWANGKYVGLSGDQTINGTKTFADNMHTTRTMADSYSTFFFKATKNRDIEPKGRSELFSYIRTGAVVPAGQNDYIGAIGVQREADGTYSHNVNVQAYDSNGVQKTSSSVRAVANLDGTHYATASYRIANQSDGDIVTFGMVPTLADIVHTTGNQYVAGTKTFTAPIRGLGEGITYSTTNMLKGIDINVFSAWDSRIRIVDMNNHYIAGWGSEATSSARVTFMNVIGLNNIQARFDVKITDTGIKYMTGPHRSTGQSDDDIVTYGMLKELGLIKG